MNFNMNVNKEQWKEIGNTGLRIGKFIVVEGTKALVLKTAAKAITTSFEDGIGGVKQIGLDDIIGKKKEDKPKKKWFGKKEDVVEELLEIAVENTVEDKLKKADEILADK